MRFTNAGLAHPSPVGIQPPDRPRPGQRQRKAVPRVARTSDLLQSLVFLLPCISQSDQHQRLRLDAQSIRCGSPCRDDAIQCLGAAFQRLLQPAFLIPTGTGRYCTYSNRARHRARSARPNPVRLAVVRPCLRFLPSTVHRFGRRAVVPWSHGNKIGSHRMMRITATATCTGKCIPAFELRRPTYHFFPTYLRKQQCRLRVGLESGKCGWRASGSALGLRVAVIVAAASAASPQPAIFMGANSPVIGSSAENRRGATSDPNTPREPTGN